MSESPDYNILERMREQEQKAADRTLFWLLMLLIAAVAACIDKWCLDAAGWTEAEIDRFFLERFDCSQQKYTMAKAIADLQEKIDQLKTK